VTADFASTAGWRNVFDVTSTPMRIRSVTAASAPSSDHASKYGPCGRLGWTMWSHSHALS
jgi:hypothetical protein